MAGEEAESQSERTDIVERQSLCLVPKTGPKEVLHHGDKGFLEEQGKLLPTAESNATEKLVNLKSRLRVADNEEFWLQISAGMADILGAQYTFVSKRILVDDENVAVEMPPIGQPGSCLMGVVYYYNDGKDQNGNIRDIKYRAFGCPCAYMKHDKVLIIPERIEEIFSENPNAPNLVIPCEAYLGIPLFSGGKCFGHFGAMWSPEGASGRKVSWTFQEMALHSLEDMILDRLLRGDSFSKIPRSSAPPSKVVPYEAVTAAQSLKPYARSLSHELRTPMQGVVGMLDVMYATVQEAAEGQTNPRIRKIFDTLKENIEVVQDSSRRAVEAADNVVYAYDMNMGVPDAPSSPLDEEVRENPQSPEFEHRPKIVVNGSNMPINPRGSKRRRESVTDSADHPAKVHLRNPSQPPHAQFHHVSASEPPRVEHVRAEMPWNHQETGHFGTGPQSPVSDDILPSPVFTFEHSVVPGYRNTNLREVLQYVVNDSLKVGGRPESAIAQETDGGEIIEVRTKGRDGTEGVKIIDWSVDPAVPDTMFIDEKDLSKMISCVFLNAVKFTDEGRITVRARLSPRYRYIVIKVKDTGSGIPSGFLPNLFKPFSREDDSLTRRSEGLGLGLLVAKGLARKLKGDLFCIHSEIDGPNRGTEFEMRVPITPSDARSRMTTPFGSPTPPARSMHSADADVPPLDEAAIPGAPKTPPLVVNCLRDALKDQPNLTTPPPSAYPSSTPALTESPVTHSGTPKRRPSLDRARRVSAKKTGYDRDLAQKHPLTFLVAEDNKINRSLLVSMLRKFGYTSIYEAYDGADAVRQMTIDRGRGQDIDVVLMDLWMPYMNGYEATERILAMGREGSKGRRAKTPTILAVTADVTDGALEKAAKAGMKGFMTKPYKLLDLEKLIVDYCAIRTPSEEAG